MTTLSDQRAVADSTDRSDELDALYDDFAAAGLTPLWRTREDLMPAVPSPRAVPHVWRWSELYPLAARSGALVPVGRGGERRAIGLGNPGLPADPYATPTLWAAVQYLNPRESAPAHRHSQSAFRFVLAGEGVWTVVDGDPVAMRRGDLLLTPGWHFHGHRNVSDAPMAWLDGLDIPLVSGLDQGFFEFGDNPTNGGDALTTMRTEMHRLTAGATTRPTRTTASSVWQVFSGARSVIFDGQPRRLGLGDVVAVPAWTSLALQADDGLDLFTFSDAPVLEKLDLIRTEAG